MLQTVGGILHYFNWEHNIHALLNSIWCDWGERHSKWEFPIFHINIKWTCNKLLWYWFGWIGVSKRRRQRNMQIKWFICDDIWCWLNRIHGRFNAYGRQFFNIYSLVLNKRWQRFCMVFATNPTNFKPKSSDFLVNGKPIFPCQPENCEPFRTDGNRYMLTVDYSILHNIMQKFIQIYRDAITLYISFADFTVVSHSTFCLK